MAVEEQKTLWSTPEDQIKGQNQHKEGDSDAPKEKVKEDDKKEKKASTGKKKAEPKEERYRGQLIFVSGPQHTPMNLDTTFGNNEDYQTNGATKEMIKKVAVTVFKELLQPNIDIEIVEDNGQQFCFLTNTLSKKGSEYFTEDGPQIVCQSETIPFEQIEQYFQYIYEQQKTEARALVYYHKLMKQYYFVIPKNISRSKSETVDSYDYCLGGNVNIYLVADLHSHHEMSNKFSRTDDLDETGRCNILFGIFSFVDSWNFRFCRTKNPGFVFSYVTMGFVKKWISSL